ncbi:MAG: hypothetical protein NUW37_12905 [Planctomycetes bacterium]|nr:hypothetical protein [Planctomycetota bacterium]
MRNTVCRLFFIASALIFSSGCVTWVEAEIEIAPAEIAPMENVNVFKVKKTIEDAGNEPPVSAPWVVSLFEMYFEQQAGKRFHNNSDFAVSFTEIEVAIEPVATDVPNEYMVRVSSEGDLKNRRNEVVATIATKCESAFEHVHQEKDFDVSLEFREAVEYLTLCTMRSLIKKLNFTAPSGR